MGGNGPDSVSPGKPIVAIFREFRWIHIALGLIGNLGFFVGSIFFLWKSTQSLGVWLFIIGSFGMLIGSFGSLMVTWEEYRQKASRRQE